MKLITGCTGFLGGELIKRFKQSEVRVLARNEKNLVEMKQKYPEIEIITGDISDKWIVKRAMQGVDEVYHLAAIKGVDIAENQPFQAVKTNIEGTVNLLEESVIVKPNLFLFISTDKAAQVNGVYGATKMIGERLIKEAEGINKETKYRIVRYGNVLYSSGSVLCKWREKMIAGEPVMITEPMMTRFFWTREQAVDLIFSCISKAKDATPYIPKMKAMSMGNLLEAMMQKYGKVEFEVMGNRGGENLHETMDGKVYSNEVEQFTIEEIKELI